MLSPLAETWTPDPADEDLVARALAGSAEDLELLLRRHERWIYNVALRMLQRPPPPLTEATGEPTMDRLDPTQQEILRLEEGALARWCRGDPSGFLELSAPDVVYFDPFLPARLDGLGALRAHYEALRGKISAARWELVRPLVQVIDRAAVLTFQFISQGPRGEVHRWNCTEVYRRDPEGWRIVQTHWAFTAPGA